MRQLKFELFNPDVRWNTVCKRSWRFIRSMQNDCGLVSINAKDANGIKRITITELTKLSCLLSSATESIYTPDRIDNAP